MGKNSELKCACREAISLLANALEKETWLEIACNATKKTASRKERSKHKNYDNLSPLESGKT